MQKQKQLAFHGTETRLKKSNMKNTISLFPYKWKLALGFPSKGIPKHGATVFTCFAGGGGSSMGYKLAGFNVIGFNEIDEKQAKCYNANLKCEYQYIEDIRILHQRNNFPDELFNLDILDGSPPCTTFSLAGKREATWGIEKKFREGQKKQTLDDLAFEFLKLAEKLSPKIIVIENVEYILKGNAIKYVAQIKKILDSIGYFCTHVVLNAATMGVPQSRRRIFILAIRKDLIKNIALSGMIIKEPVINLKFNKKEIPFSEIDCGNDWSETTRKIVPEIKSKIARTWKKVKPGASFSTAFSKATWFGIKKVHPNCPIPTLVTAGYSLWHYNIMRALSDKELQQASTFPLDYNFCNYSPVYIMGMAVPPVMLAQIAWQIKQQWIDKIK